MGRTAIFLFGATLSAASLGGCVLAYGTPAPEIDAGPEDGGPGALDDAGAEDGGPGGSDDAGE